MTRRKQDLHPPPGAYAEIWTVVNRIPPGRVATYGQVAALAGRPGHARQAGYALHALPEASGVPWHRVVNARGAISPRAEGAWAEERQRHLLEKEGVTFDARERIDLERFGWDPEPHPRARRLRRATDPRTGRTPPARRRL